MKTAWKWAAYALLLVLLSLGGLVKAMEDASPQAWPFMELAAEPPPARETEILVSGTEQVWWLVQWKDNAITCTLFVDHGALPSNLELLQQCGQNLYKQWIATNACSAIEEGGAASSCTGLYLFFVESRPVERRVTVELPTPAVWLSLLGCLPTPPETLCSEIPSLVLEGNEPLPNEAIVAIHVIYSGRQIDCPGGRCEIPLNPTPLNGEQIEFWADSSYGDQSPLFEARLRVVDAGVSTDGGESQWLVDLISTQWMGGEFSTCAASWEAFPPIGGLPSWLVTPEDFNGLASDTPFVFLAAQLIDNGLVDASTCPDDGILPNGAANTCGLEAARGYVTDWQNLFDQTIFNVAIQNELPAQLLKNLFAQESQFWPGSFNNTEFGLGQLTELGADSVLLWNPSFFDQFCPLVLHSETCQQGYPRLKPAEQAILRGALASQSAADCPDCPMGIDLAHAQGSVEVFAQALIGNCEQVSFIVYDISNLAPGAASSYEDLWRFTLANYNAGPGCLVSAMQTAWRRARALSWDTVKLRFPAGCQKAIAYVERVTGESGFVPDFLPTLSPTSTFLPPPTITPGGQPSATSRPTGYPAPVTATPGSYPPPPTATQAVYP